MAKNRTYNTNSFEENLRRRLHKLFEENNMTVLSETSAKQTSAKQQLPESRNRKKSDSPTVSAMRPSNSRYRKGSINKSCNNFKAEGITKANRFKTQKSIKKSDNRSKNSKILNKIERKPKSSQENFASKSTKRHEKQVFGSSSEDQSKIPEYSKQEAKREQSEIEGRRLKQEIFKKASIESKKNNQCRKGLGKTKKRAHEQENQSGKMPKTEESTWVPNNSEFTTNLTENIYVNGDSPSDSEYSFSKYDDAMIDSASLADYSNEENYYSTGDEDSLFSFSDDSSCEYENYINDEPFHSWNGNCHIGVDESDDLVIHRGTANKRNLMPCDGVEFDSDVHDAQVIELEQKDPLKVILQPEECQRSILEELSSKEIHTTPLHLQLKRQTTDTEHCPQLVPALSDCYTSCSESIYEEILEGTSNQSSISILSGDVNEKYLHWDRDNANNRTHTQGVKMSADIIDASDSIDFIDANDNSLKNGTQSHSNVPDLLPSALLISELDHDATNEAIVLTHDVSKLSTNEFSVNSDTKNKRNAPINERFAEDKFALYEASIANINKECISEIPSPVLNHCVENITNPSIFYNSIDSNQVLVLLRAPIYLYGTVKLRVILGSISIYGYEPHFDKELEVFSPRGLCSVQITNNPTGTITHKIIGSNIKRFENYFSKVDLQNIEDNYSPQENALILLKRNDQKKKLLNTLKKYMNENLFPHANTAQTERSHFISECQLSCFINLDDETHKGFKVNPQWNQFNFHKHSKLMIIGGKSVGKSTLLRYILNRNLAAHPRILLIDLDIGQPEIFVPQTISATLLKQPLLGPGFFSNCQPAKAYAVGYSNAVMCPHRYMLAVKKLLQVCRANEEFRQLPWLINTMGYNKGFGAEIIAVICELLQPTNVVQLQSNKDINNFDYLMEPSVVSQIARNIYVGEEYRAPEESRTLTYKLHVINSVIAQESRFKREWEMSAKDMRYAILLARLSDALDCQAEWLTDCSPLSASLNNLKIISLVSGVYTREQLLKSVEANLVYLCRYQNENIVECLGVGVVRAIDYHTNQIYLLPALPRERMLEVDCLAIGDMPLPTSMLTNQGPKAKNIAPFVYNTVEDNATKSIKQVYFRPSQFLSGKHQHNLNNS